MKSRNRLAIVSLTLLAGMQTGCQEENGKVAILEARVAALERAQTNLLNLERIDFVPETMEASLLVLSNQVEWLQRRELTRIPSPKRKVALDPTDTSAHRLDTEVLPLFVSVTEFVPYLDGYRIRMKVGNPHFASFDGVKLMVEWGPPRKTSTIKTAASLPAGKWTPVEFNIAPAGTGDLRNVWLAIDLNEAFLDE